MKKKLLLVGLMTTLVCLATTATIIQTNSKEREIINGDDTYSIYMTSTSEFSLDNPKLTTSLGNNIPVVVEGNAQEYLGTILLMGKGSSFYNTEPVNGIKELMLEVNNGAKIDVSAGFKDGDNITYLPKRSFTGSSEKITATFDDRMPSFFKLEFNSQTFLRKIYIQYSCEGSEDIEEEYNNLPGATPVLSEDGKTITFGVYPQVRESDYSITSKVSSTSTADYYKNPVYSGASLTYINYQNKLYASKNATPVYNDCTFHDGTTVKSGTKYYYEAAPITWDVLAKEGNKYLVISHDILDSQAYYNGSYRSDVSDNNYELSTIRTWLNETFYKDAFLVNSDLIETTLVDNSGKLKDWNYDPNPYGSNDTEDKIFLLTADDFTNEEYGFPTSVQDINYVRRKTSSDYAIGQGIQYANDGTYSAYYHTRTPYYYGANFNFTISSNGYVSSNDRTCSKTTVGVVPAMYITIPEQKEWAK